MDDLTFRPAKHTDASLLAELNQQLQIDESHRRRMKLPELERRMADWLQAGGYQAVIFERRGRPVGYALYRRETEPDDFYYLKQFFVCRDCRRQGVGREAIAWLIALAWRDSPMVYLDVLSNNARGIEFWRAIGFADYSITMECRLVNVQE
jgi:GNAT superfamily N-acetyltransferase